MTQDRGTLTGTASALDTEDSFIRKYSARHASGKAAIAIQAAPSGQIKSLLYRRPGSTRTPGVYINISSALLLDIARVASTTQFFASCASWSGHGHSAWLLPRVPLRWLALPTLRHALRCIFLRIIYTLCVKSTRCPRDGTPVLESS